MEKQKCRCGKEMTDVDPEGNESIFYCHNCGRLLIYNAGENWYESKAIVQK